MPTTASIIPAPVESTTPPIPPPPANYETPTSIHTSPPNEHLSNSHVLDIILDELNAPTDSKTRVNAEVTATFKYKIPPRPPERLVKFD